MKNNLHAVYLGLGANVGKKKENIEKTIELLGLSISDINLSKIYETKPWGYKKQDNFLNAVVKGKTTLSPGELLELTKSIEKKIGRVYRFRWGPREIDIDILFYNNTVHKEISLEIPHPRLHLRDFVLKPLMDIDSNFVHPILKKAVHQLYKELSEADLSIVKIYV